MTRSPIRRVRRASAYAVLSSVTSALFLFWTFRLTVQLEGVTTIGCWSLIQGMFLFARIGDSGAGANITRFLAHDEKLGRSRASAKRVFATGAALSTLPVVVLGAGVSPLIYQYVSSRYESSVSSSVILDLTVSALVFGVVSSLATIGLSAVEGLLLLSTRGVIVIAANIVGASLAYPLIATWGAMGLGIAYISVAVVQLVGAAAAVGITDRRENHGISLSTREVATLLWKENLQLSAIAVVQLAFEPAVKFALSLIGGLGQIAAFELALRLVTQLRVLFQAAMQPLLAVGARTRDAAVATADVARFKRVRRLLYRFAAVPFVILVATSPLFSYLGLGEVSETFVAMLSILVIGNFINVLGIPGYYLLLSGAELPRLFTLQAVMGGIVVASAGIGVALSGVYVVVGGYALAFALGGTYLARSLTVGARHRPRASAAP